MSTTRRIGTAVAVTAAATAGFAALGGVAGASWPTHPAAHPEAVFVQTDGLTGNAVVAYDRNPGGSLSAAGTYATGGLGGALSGSIVDHLASQGSLTYDQVNDLLYAVNAGSNTVSVFSVRGDQLTLRQVIGSGGLCAERRGRWVDPGLCPVLRPPSCCTELEPSTGPRHDGGIGVHGHAGPGGVLPRRPGTAGHHQGQHELDRRFHLRLLR
jgi:hypothetical protein